MSHTLRKINIGNSALVEATIIDYVQGGETFTLAELGITGPVTSILFIPISGQPYNSTPQLLGGVVKLMDLSGNRGEIPSQVGINFTLLAIVHGQ